MNTQVETSVENGVARVSIKGELCLDSVGVVHQRVNLSTLGTEIIEFDFGGVTRTDSAAAALCVEWFSQARRNGVSVKFINPPDVLMRIARVNKLEGLFQADSRTSSHCVDS